jgi:hypothetical protein
VLLDSTDGPTDISTPEHPHVKPGHDADKAATVTSMPVTVLTFADMLAEHRAAGFEQVAHWDVPRRPSWAPEQPEVIDQALPLAHLETGVFAHLSQYTGAPGLTPWVSSVRWAFNALVFDIAAFCRQLPHGNGRLLQPGVVRRVDAGRRFEKVAAGRCRCRPRGGLLRRRLGARANHTRSVDCCWSECAPSAFW